jgi:hypothetical protein
VRSHDCEILGKNIVRPVLQKPSGISGVDGDLGAVEIDCFFDVIGCKDRAARSRYEAFFDAVNCSPK